ncbi:hypothetical protein Hanom_Chr02g00177571 [Helianthus anomalus]
MSFALTIHTYPKHQTKRSITEMQYPPKTYHLYVTLHLKLWLKVFVSISIYTKFISMAVDIYTFILKNSFITKFISIPVDIICLY